MPALRDLLLSNARLVLADRVIDNGWIAIENGVITEIGEGRPPESGEDLDGDLLLPGLVELHTDQIEFPLHAAAEGLLGSGRRGRFL